MTTCIFYVIAIKIQNLDLVRGLEVKRKKRIQILNHPILNNSIQILGRILSHPILNNNIQIHILSHPILKTSIQIHILSHPILGNSIQTQIINPPILDSRVQIRKGLSINYIYILQTCEP